MRADFTRGDKRRLCVLLDINLKQNKTTATTTTKTQHGQDPYEKSEINDIKCFRLITLTRATEEIVFLFPGLDEMNSVLSANKIKFLHFPYRSFLLPCAGAVLFGKGNKILKVNELAMVKIPP
mgnify:CR=1 FL=1